MQPFTRVSFLSNIIHQLWAWCKMGIPYTVQKYALGRLLWRRLAALAFIWPPWEAVGGRQWEPVIIRCTSTLHAVRKNSAWVCADALWKHKYRRSYFCSDTGLLTRCHCVDILLKCKSQLEHVLHCAFWNTPVELYSMRRNFWKVIMMRRSQCFGGMDCHGAHCSQLLLLFIRRDWICMRH